MHWRPDTLSRTADHMFWMVRYMERAENTARLLDVNYPMSNTALLLDVKFQSLASAAPRAAQRSEVRPHRRDPGHGSACLPDAIPRPRQRSRCGHRPRFSGADGGLSRRCCPRRLGGRTASGRTSVLGRGGPARRCIGVNKEHANAGDAGCLPTARRFCIVTNAFARSLRHLVRSAFLGIDCPTRVHFFAW